MPFHHPTKQTHQKAAILRHNLTQPEARLWSQLRAKRLCGIHFRRQYAIGNYIVDFCAPRRRLIIELDGSQHMDQRDYDDKRNQFLASKGYRVLRFWNDDITNNLEVVIKEIQYWLDEDLNNFPPPSSPK